MQVRWQTKMIARTVSVVNPCLLCKVQKHIWHARPARIMLVHFLEAIS